jgi:hypothetical protein
MKGLGDLMWMDTIVSDLIAELKVEKYKKVDPEAKADMLAELVVESGKLMIDIVNGDPKKSTWSVDRQKKYLWKCMWGVRHKHKRLRLCIDKPKGRFNNLKEHDPSDPEYDPALDFRILDLDLSWDEVDRGVDHVTEAMGVEDVWSDLMRVVTDPLDSRIIGMKSEGFNNREISEQLGCVTEMTVWNRVDAMKKKLKRADGVRYAHI